MLPGTSIVTHIACIKQQQQDNNQIYFQDSPATETQEKEAMEVIKVAARSRSTAVAGAIAGVIREHGRAEVQAIGAGAVNQAVKAAAIARGYLELDGIDAVCIPSFVEVEIDGQE